MRTHEPATRLAGGACHRLILSHRLHNSDAQCILWNEVIRLFVCADLWFSFCCEQTLNNRRVCICETTPCSVHSCKTNPSFGCRPLKRLLSFWTQRLLTEALERKKEETAIFSTHCMYTSIALDKRELVRYYPFEYNIIFFYISPIQILI